MQRTKKPIKNVDRDHTPPPAPEPKKVKFRKIGGGSFRMANGKIIKPGQVFEAFPEQIPGAFRDVVVPLEPELEDPPVEVTPPGYEIVKSPEKGKWNVVNAQGKAINENPLSREDADVLVKELS